MDGRFQEAKNVNANFAIELAITLSSAHEVLQPCDVTTFIQVVQQLTHQAEKKRTTNSIWITDSIAACTFICTTVFAVEH